MENEHKTTSLSALQNTSQSSGGEVRAGFFSLKGFELLQRAAKAISTSGLVPAAYENNLANCMIAMDMAQRLDANPMMVMQNLYIVHNQPGWSSKFLIATVNASGRFSSLRYEWKGKEGDSDFGCRAWAIEEKTGERLDGVWITWEMVKAERWDDKNGSKWKTMPQQMFVYRAAAFWQRAYAPEIGMGLSTQEELLDVVDVDPRGEVKGLSTESMRASAVRKDITPKPKGQEEDVEEAKQVPPQKHDDAVDAASPLASSGDKEKPAAPKPQPKRSTMPSLNIE